MKWYSMLWLTFVLRWWYYYWSTPVVIIQATGICLLLHWYSSYFVILLFIVGIYYSWKMILTVFYVSTYCDPIILRWPLIYYCIQSIYCWRIWPVLKRWLLSYYCYYYSIGIRGMMIFVLMTDKWESDRPIANITSLIAVTGWYNYSVLYCMLYCAIYCYYSILL